MSEFVFATSGCDLKKYGLNCKKVILSQMKWVWLGGRDTGCSETLMGLLKKN